MADYIDKNILCQAYVHVDLPVGITPEQLETIKQHLTEFANSRAKFFVYPEVEVEVEFKEGSLKTYITIAGSIYVAIVGYGEFRHGVDYLYTDVKRLADTMVAESLFMTKAKHASIRRTEARTGVVGSLKLLVDEINTLEASLGQISVDEAARRIKRIKDDAEVLISNVRDDQDIDSIEDDLDRFADKLPEPCPYPLDRRPDDLAVINYHDILAEFRKTYGSRKKKKK